MDRNAAFEHCLEHAIKPHVEKSTWASYKHRYYAGTLKQSTITELLLGYEYILHREEDWLPPGEMGEPEPEIKPFVSREQGAELRKINGVGDSFLKVQVGPLDTEPEEQYFDVVIFEKNSTSFRLKTVMADNPKDAVKKAGGNGKEVTGDLRALIDYVNTTIENYTS